MENRRTALGWMDLVWLAFLGGLALQRPLFEIHKLFTLLAIGLFQIFHAAGRINPDHTVGPHTQLPQPLADLPYARPQHIQGQPLASLTVRAGILRKLRDNYLISGCGVLVQRLLFAGCTVVFVTHEGRD